MSTARSIAAAAASVARTAMSENQALVYQSAAFALFASILTLSGVYYGHPALIGIGGLALGFSASSGYLAYQRSKLLLTTYKILVELEAETP